MRWPPTKILYARRSREVLHSQRFATHLQELLIESSMRHRDFEVLVTCEGEPLHEYAVTSDGNAIECYVVSEPGKVCCWSR